MLLLQVWVVTVAGWVVSAAPPAAHTSPSSSLAPPAPRTAPSTPLPPPTGHKEGGADLLGPALRDLGRRKRGNSKSNLPYSNYRPVAGVHRYRYPLYKKRSYPPQYDYQEDLLLPEEDYLGYPEEEEGAEGASYSPSLFRERNRKESNNLFEDDGYFTDDYYPLPNEDPDVDELLDNQLARKKDYMYHLYNLPSSDLERLNYMYEMGKRDPDLASLDLPAGVMDQLHGVGRKTFAPSPSERFYDAINYVRSEEEERRRKKKSQGVAKRSDYDPTRGEKLRKLQTYLTSAAGRYFRGRDVNEEVESRMNIENPMIRRKRDTKRSTSTPAKSSKIAKKPSPSSQLPIARNKRAFSDYFKWEKKSPASSYDDYLTREYFKSIARSVGQKKKRMAYAQFEASYPESSKRSGHEASKRLMAKRGGYNMDELLNSPTMLHYMQEKLKEAEEVVARDAETEVLDGDENGLKDKLISVAILRLDALERMRAALGQLEELQHDQEANNKKKRSGDLEEEARRKRLQQQEEEEAQQEERRRRGGAQKKRSVRRRLRRGDNDLSDLFLGNSIEDCPVLERLVLNCEGVSEEVGDEEQVFLPHCLRHEICYMCGASESVTGHECDAILSSGLEAACSTTVSLATSRSLDCLSAAGTTFSMLSDHARYDEDGVCTQDPCVRRFLESR